MDTTRSKGEALAILKRSRKPLIDRAVYEAIQLAKNNGSVHSRQVRERMDCLGFLTDPNLDDRWLGAVFNRDTFTKVGETIAIDTKRNIHARPIPVWALADASVQMEMPDDPVGF